MRKSNSRGKPRKLGRRFYSPVIPQWKLVAGIVLVCAVAGFFTSILVGADYKAAVNYFLFGVPNPKISAGRYKELKKEFKKILKEEFEGG